MGKRTLARRQLFAHVPYRFLRREPAAVIGRRVQPEIYFSSSDLEGFDRGEGERLAAALRGAGLDCTFHAPFLDLNPGALDPEVRRLTLERYRQVLDAARSFGPRIVVFHPGYDRWRYDGKVEPWLGEALATFGEVLEIMERDTPGTLMAVENIYETEPSSLAELLGRLGSPRAGCCFDSGHFLLFSRSGVDEWIDALGDRLVELHLHDNDGLRDAHLPPGEGKFPFPTLLRRVGPPVSAGRIRLTIEAHSIADLERSLAWLGRRFKLEDESSTGADDINN